MLVTFSLNLDDAVMLKESLAFLRKALRLNPQLANDFCYGLDELSGVIRALDKQRSDLELAQLRIGGPQDWC